MNVLDVWMVAVFMFGWMDGCLVVLMMDGINVCMIDRWWTDVFSQG